MKYLKQDKFDREFYVALMLYDVCNIPIENVTEETIEATHEIIDSYDSIYDYDLRDRVNAEIYIYNNELEESNEEIERE